MRSSRLIAAAVLTLVACESLAQLPPAFVPSTPTTGQKPGSVPRPTTYGGYYHPPSVTPSATSRPPSYADYYKNQVKQYKRPPASPSQYIVDKYFYSNENISPYLNLARNTSGVTNNYYGYVRPELDRRRRAIEAEVSPHIRTGGDHVGSNSKSKRKPVPTATRNPYFDYFYAPPNQ